MDECFQFQLAQRGTLHSKVYVQRDMHNITPMTHIHTIVSGYLNIPEESLDFLLVQ